MGVDKEEYEKLDKLKNMSDELKKNIENTNNQVGEVIHYGEEIISLKSELKSFQRKLTTDLENKSMKEIQSSPKLIFSDRGIEDYGAQIQRYNGLVVKSGFKEFDNYILENTPIKAFLNKFGSTDEEYSDFKQVLEEYKGAFNKEGMSLSYYRTSGAGMPGSIVLSIPKDGGKFAHLFKEQVIDQDLYEKQKPKELYESIDKIQESLEHLNKKVEIDEKLIDLKKKIGATDEELKKYFGVSDLHGDYKKIGSLAFDLFYATFKDPKTGMYARTLESSDMINDEMIYVPKNSNHLQTSEDAKQGGNSQKNSRRSVKRYFSGYKVMKEGKLLIKKGFDTPKRSYEEGRGGKITRNQEYNVSEMINIQEEDDELKVTYMNGDNDEITDKYEKPKD